MMINMLNSLALLELSRALLNGWLTLEEYTAVIAAAPEGTIIEA